MLLEYDRTQGWISNKRKIKRKNAKLNGYQVTGVNNYGEQAEFVDQV